MVTEICESFFEALGVIAIAICSYLIAFIIFRLLKLKITTHNHILKKTIKAQNKVIASLCNALHR